MVQRTDPEIKLQVKIPLMTSLHWQEPVSASKQQNGRKMPAALAKKEATPQKEPASKPSRSGKSQTPSKQQPSTAKGKRKAVNIITDDDDDNDDDDFEVLPPDNKYPMADRAVLRDAAQPLLREVVSCLPLMTIIALQSSP